MAILMVECHSHYEQGLICWATWRKKLSKWWDDFRKLWQWGLPYCTHKYVKLGNIRTNWAYPNIGMIHQSRWVTQLQYRAVWSQSRRCVKRTSWIRNQAHCFMDSTSISIIVGNIPTNLFHSGNENFEPDGRRGFGLRLVFQAGRSWAIDGDITTPLVFIVNLRLECYKDWV